VRARWAGSGSCGRHEGLFASHGPSAHPCCRRSGTLGRTGGPSSGCPRNSRLESPRHHVLIHSTRGGGSSRLATILIPLVCHFSRNLVRCRAFFFPSSSTTTLTSALVDFVFFFGGRCAPNLVAPPESLRAAISMQGSLRVAREDVEDALEAAGVPTGSPVVHALLAGAPTDAKAPDTLCLDPASESLLIRVSWQAWWFFGLRSGEPTCTRSAPPHSQPPRRGCMWPGSGSCWSHCFLQFATHARPCHVKGPGCRTRSPLFRQPLLACSWPPRVVSNFDFWGPTARPSGGGWQWPLVAPALRLSLLAPSATPLPVPRA
jgi:hypothetical protein